MSEEREAAKATRYSAASIERHFDEYGDREWNRLVETPVDEVSLHIHTHYLRKHIPAGARVLEVGAGAGRFTQILANLGARVLVADVSAVQLELNKRHAQQYGFAEAVEDWQQVDICDMGRYTAGTFDRVVAYGGPLSYVLDRRDVALGECLRVLRSGGTLLFSVMSLWGSAHRHLQGVLAIPMEANRRIIETGDLLPETFPGREGNFMHMFRASEVREWLSRSGVTLLDLSASGCLSIGWEAALEQIRDDPEAWGELLRIEVEASAEEGSLNMGTHLIGVVRKPGGDLPTPNSTPSSFV